MIVDALSEFRTSLANPDRDLLRGLGVRATRSGVDVTEETALSSTAVWAAVRLISETMGSVPLHVFRRTDRGKEVATDHPLDEVLRLDPNPEQTSMERREMQQSFLLTSGNCYDQIIYNGAGAVEALWPLTPHRVRPVRAPGTGRVHYEVMLPNGQRTILPPEEVLHVKAFVRDGLLGTDVIAQMRESIGFTLATEQHGATFFGNSSAPGGAIQHPALLSDKAFGHLRESWEKEHRGVNNAHRVAILEEGATWVATGVPNDNAQYIENREFQVTEVARIFGVPPHMIGDLAHATFSNIEQQSGEYVRYTVRVWAVRWEQAMDKRLLTPADRKQHFTRHNLDGLLRGDIETRYKAYSIGRQNSWLSANDVRELEDLNIIEAEGGDDYHLQVNMMRLQDGGMLAAQPDVPPPEIDEDEGRTELRAVQERSVAGRVRTRSAFERLLLDIANRAVTREAGGVRKALRKGLGGRDAATFRQLLDEFYEGHQTWLEGAFRAVLQSLAETVGTEVGTELARKDLPDLADFLDEYLSAFAVRQVESAKGQLAAIMRDTDPEDQEAAIEQRVSDWEATKSGKIARREATRAMNAFSFATYAALGVTLLRWVTVGLNCPLCTMLNGRVTDITTPLVGAGEKIDPGGDTSPLTTRRVHRHPPLHDGCDCTIVAG